jgi:hypothetical protein
MDVPAVWRRIRIVLGARSSRSCITSRTASCSQRLTRRCRHFLGGPSRGGARARPREWHRQKVTPPDAIPTTPGLTREQFRRSFHPPCWQVQPTRRRSSFLEPLPGGPYVPLAHLEHWVTPSRAGNVVSATGLEMRGWVTAASLHIDLQVGSRAPEHCSVVSRSD